MESDRKNGGVGKCAPVGERLPYVLSIAGLDPSAGAGLLADIKTFEQCGVYGLGVATAITCQHDSAYRSTEWLPVQTIVDQLEPLLERYDIRFIKIGLIESFDVLAQLISHLEGRIDRPVIVYDPILTASAGAVFHANVCTGAYNTIFEKVYCLTPNIPEAEALLGPVDDESTYEALSNRFAIYLKGGHGTGDRATDTLFARGTQYKFAGPRLAQGAKHGSGCVLSAAITSYLARGLTLPDAAAKTFEYMRHYLGSSPTLLGIHRNIET